MLNPGALEAQLRSLGIREAAARVLSGGNLGPRCQGELRTLQALNAAGVSGPDVYPSHRLDFQGLRRALPLRLAGSFGRLP